MNNYPYSKIILRYLIFGGILGAFLSSFLFTLMTFITSLFEGKLLTIELLAYFAFSLMFAIYFFIISTLSYSIIICLLKIHYDDNHRKLKTMAIGFFVPIIGLLIVFFDNIKNIHSVDIIVIFMPVAIAGAISSLIVGKYALPKRPIQSE